MYIPTRTRLTYSNDKPRFTANLRQPCQAKEDAYRKGDIVLYKQAKYTLEKEIRVAKRNYSDKLRNLPVILLQCGKVWKTERITRHHPPALWRINNWQMILITFTVDLEKLPTPALNTSTQQLTPPATPYLPHQHWKQVKMTCARSSERTKEGKHQNQTPVCHQPALKPALTSCPPSSQRSLTDHWSCVKSPRASNAPPSSPSQRNPKLLDLTSTDLWL